MARVGRGRTRGSRVLDTQDLLVPARGMGHGRVMIGRGTSFAPLTNVKENEAIFFDSGTGKHSDAEEQIHPSLDEQLLKFEQTGKGSFIHITINYFDRNEDVEYYIDKVMEFLLKCSHMVVNFASCFKLISLLKKHGNQIKLTMFSKLQNVFQNMFLVMKDRSSLNENDQNSLRNFSELVGQLYFRFRLHLNSLERYDILSVPTLECMMYLVNANSPQDFFVLIKLISLNYTDLHKLYKDKITELSIILRQRLLDPVCPESLSPWLICAIDVIYSQEGGLSPALCAFYTEQLGEDWLLAIPSSPIQLLAPIPLDISQSQMYRFDILLDEYNKNRTIFL